MNSPPIWTRPTRPGTVLPVWTAILSASLSADVVPLGDAWSWSVVEVATGRTVAFGRATTLIDAQRAAEAAGKEPPCPAK